jgi:hypothetical protein
VGTLFGFWLFWFIWGWLFASLGFWFQVLQLVQWRGWR